MTLGAYDYGEMVPFAESSEQTKFALGEGLPGKVWAEGRPIVLKDLDNSYFLRKEAAREAGLTCAVAIPVLAGSVVKAVLVVLCGDDRDHVGAIEVWQDKEQRLHLDSGYYGTASSFEAASKDVTFGHGEGLPGGVWAANMPVLMRDIGANHGFIRAQSAQEVGLQTGLGLPVPCLDDTTHVVTLLSAANTPLAHRFEIWDARPERVGSKQVAVRIDGICEREGPLWPKDNPPTDMVTVSAWQGPIGQVLGSGLPHVSSDGTGLPAGYRKMVALPIYHDDNLAFITAWYL